MIQSKEMIMKIAVPTANGLLNAHFGHCEAFAIIEVDPDTKAILNRSDIDAPPHEPGLLPRWLGEKGVNLIIAGGMGQRAQMLFNQQNIQVIVGVPCEAPEKLVNAYLSGTIQSGVNLCDH